MFLPLAEKKIQKFVEEGKINAEAEVELYLMILNKQKKYDEMLKLINSTLGTDYLTNHLDFLTRKKAQIYVSQCKWKEAFEAYRALIEGNPDQLNFYNEWFSIALKLDEDGLRVTDDKKSSISQAVDLIRKFSEKGLKKASSFGKLRGPYLAKIELYCLLKETEKTHQAEKFKLLRDRIALNGGDLLVEYYNNFGYKPCCYPDICYIFSKFPASLEYLPYVSKCVL